MKHLKVAILVFLLLGCAGIAAHHAAVPYPVALSIAELQVEPGGILAADLSVDWPLKVNKEAWDKITVELPDGSQAEQVNNSELVDGIEGNVFAVYRERILFRLDAGLRDRPDAAIHVFAPIKLRDFLYKVSFSAAAVLTLLLWLGPGLRSTLVPFSPRRLSALALVLGIAIAGLFWLPAASKAGVWLALGMFLTGPFAAAAMLLRAEEQVTQKPSRTREPLTGAALLIATVLVSCALFEVAFDLMADNFEATIESVKEAEEPTEAWFQLPPGIVRQAMVRKEALTLPDSWRRRAVEVDEASLAYNWHGVLHLHDKEGFRRLNRPFPPKAPETFRIMVIGDSKTYGYGIDERWTYSSILERGLAPRYRVEVINLGRSGFQSADILNVLRQHLPRLNPDLVIYGICLNDFLPSRTGTYIRYAVPLPEAWKVFLNERTYLAKVAGDAYGQALLAVGMRVDFLDDILAEKKAYQTRFAKDISSMSRVVRESGLPPILGFVFNHWSWENPRGWDLVAIAEKAMSEAGFDVVSVMDWREKYKDVNFAVSRWDSHPNELAHSLIAERLHQHLEDRGHLKSYEVTP